MAIDGEEVLRIAALARLDVPAESVDPLRRELAKILDYVALLDTLDVGNVPATSNPLGGSQPRRDDLPRPGLGAERATANAPDAADGHFRVPPVIEG